MQAEPHEASPSLQSIIDRHSSRAGGDRGAVPPSRTAVGEYCQHWLSDQRTIFLSLEEQHTFRASKVIYRRPFIDLLRQVMTVQEPAPQWASQQSTVDSVPVAQLRLSVGPVSVGISRGTRISRAITAHRWRTGIAAPSSPRLDSVLRNRLGGAATPPRRRRIRYLAASTSSASRRRSSCARSGPGQHCG
jgi:hypothetical protein